MDWTKLIQERELQQLIINHEENLPLRGTQQERSLQPIVKLHIPFTYCVWLLSECDNDGIAFGLCQIQVAELRNVWLPEVADIDINGLEVVQDTDFNPTMTLTEYADKARSNGGLLLI